MESIQQVIDDVENFIHDIETKNVIVTDKADTVMAYETGKGILGRSTKKEIANLKSVLGTSIAEYKINKHFPVLRWEYARICEAYIDLARTNNVLEYPNLSAKAQKFDELEKEHEKLKRDHIKLLKSYNELLREKEKLEKDNKILHGFDSKDNKQNKGGFVSGGLHKP